MCNDNSNVADEVIEFADFFKDNDKDEDSKERT